MIDFKVTKKKLFDIVIVAVTTVRGWTYELIHIFWQNVVQRVLAESIDCMCGDFAVMLLA